MKWETQRCAAGRSVGRGTGDQSGAAEGGTGGVAIISTIKGSRLHSTYKMRARAGNVKALGGGKVSVCFLVRFESASLARSYKERRSGGTDPKARV